MKRTALLVAAVGLAACALAVPDNIFRNMLAVPGSYFPSLNEYGDKITLGAGSRNLTSFTFAYIGDITTGQNDETVKVRVYDATGANGGPGTLLWQSGDMPIRDGVWNKTVVIPGGITVPDDIIYTVEFKNMANIQGDRAGLVLSNPPTRGSSTDDFWMFDTGTWGEFFFGGNPIANFEASFWVDGEAPQPYQNENPNAGYYFPFFFEPGDQIQLEGTKRAVTKVRFSLYCPALQTPGDERVIVKLWKLDGADQAPNTLLWASAPIPFVADPNNLQIFEVDVPSVTVEDSIVWTTEFQGVTQPNPPTDSVGVIITGEYNAMTQTRTDFEPQLGSSNDYFIARNVPGQPTWSYWIFTQPGPQANFEFAMEGSGLTKVQPNSFTIARGHFVSGNLQSLLTQDSDRLIIREQTRIFVAQESIGLIVDGTSPTPTPSALTMKIVMRTTAFPATGVEFRVLGILGNGSSEQLASVLGSAGDQTITITPAGDLSRFVQSGTNRLRLRLQIHDLGSLAAFNWTGQFNFVSWEVQ